MKNYQRINNLIGWFAFAISAFVYLSTIEPTASWWDCGEYIATAFKLQVGHPPGAPLFQMIGRFFSLFAFGDTSHVAMMVNSMSALCSAFTILFLFWTITMLGRKLTLAHGEMTPAKMYTIFASGFVGAMAYTFTDSFWFSAVEGEVYAMSSFFTAMVFWAILKWEIVADEKHSLRWLVLIAFLMGLSIGVHLLNLLAIPAITFVFYFRKYKVTRKGIIISALVSLLILSFIMYGVIPYIVELSGKFELLFVNDFGLPFNSGTVIYFALLIGLITWGLIYTRKHKKVLFNTMILGLLAILIGYSSFLMLVIRANVNTPINENDPRDAISLLSYLNREQYGDWPLLTGQYYNAPVTDYKDGSPVYIKDYKKGKYVITDDRKGTVLVYDKRLTTIFPRMWNAQRKGATEFYQKWGGDKGTPIQIEKPDGTTQTVVKPTFAENLKFFFSYQVGWMYLRYFMWNFAGRQNDIQGFGNATDGNWYSGIPFIDTPRIGPQENLPENMANRAKNALYMLPLLLGLVGMFYQFNKDSRDGWVILLLFLMTGVAIVVYLNQQPYEPRERDYAYAGSFYFFAIWIGLGVLALFEGLSRIISEKIAAPVAGLICFFTVPVLMGSENWTDHNRSGRYLTRDVAFDYLNSCAPGAILFTNGDNDTFPLWYAQEVEGKRTDVRVCNLMLLNTDWYIDQMKDRTNDSAPLPVTLPVTKYYDGINNQVFIVEKTKDPVDISTVIEWVNSDNKGTKVQVSASEILDIIPSRTIRIPVDAAKVIASGTVKPEDADKIVPYIDIKLKGNAIFKSQLIVLDILAHNNWQRPIYFVTGYHSDALGLEEYFQLEGLAFRLVPIKSQNKNWLDYGRIDTDILYENMMKKFVWGGANVKGVNIDYNHKRTIIVIKARLNYARLAKALAAEGKNEKALEVLDYCMNTFPLEKFSYDPYMADIIESYFAAGATEKALEMTKAFSDYYYSLLDYYLKQKPYIINSAEFEIQTAIQYTSRVASACSLFGKPEIGDGITKKLESYYTDYVKKLNPSGK